MESNDNFTITIYINEQGHKQEITLKRDTYHGLTRQDLLDGFKDCLRGLSYTLPEDFGGDII